MRLKLISFFTLSLLLHTAVTFAKMESASGKVYEVFPTDDQLTVSVEENGVAHIIPIKVNLETHYSGISNLGNLRLDQPIKVEFIQDEKGEFVAKTLEATPIPPAPVKRKEKS